MSVKLWIFYSFIATLCIHVSGETTAAMYDCPYGWEEHVDHCYRYVRDPTYVRDSAKAECSIDGAYLLSVNDDLEHNFVVQMLDNSYDSGQEKQIWWTSGRRKDLTGDTENVTMEFYWEGDGTDIESYFYWHNDSVPSNKEKDFIQYYFDGVDWGWIVGLHEDKLPIICEISKDEIYKISQGERGPDYGMSDVDPDEVPVGPKFTQQPIDTVFEPSTGATDVSIECIANGYPPPTYVWYKFRAGDETPIDPTDERYTMINGKLIIHNPSVDYQDDGNYQCTAQNNLGLIVSNEISLSFGYLQDFPKSPRAPVVAIEYQYISIECNPPAHYPEILYSWYKDDIYNFIRPELKPYIMISHDGRLYFSEVTDDDIGQYFCLVYKPNTMASEGKVSMPTELQVKEASPGIYEPEIGSGFPFIYPDSPMIGDDVRLECWASGTSSPEPLIYSWEKIEWINDEKIVIPMPPQAYLTDHNRVLTIPEVNLYDAGEFNCIVERLNGLATEESVKLILHSVPYFILELSDQYADVAAELRWRCEAGGEPTPSYFWLKNNVELNNDTIPAEDNDRVIVSNNVLTFTSLDPAKDNGSYQCGARNSHGTRYSTAELRVLSLPPNFDKYPLNANQFATINGNTTLMCRPEAAPYPEYEAITWYKDGSPLSPGDEESGARLTKMMNGNLLISPVYSSDTGTYTCSVFNAFGEASTTGNLTVLPTTSITYPPQTGSIEVNHTRFLHCVASYDPRLDLTYVWYENDVIIDFELVFRLGEDKYEMWYNPHFKRGTGIYNGGLYIMNAQLYHKGRYTCVVESSSGSMTAEADIAIIGPPYEPAGVFHETSTVTSTSVMVRWKESANNGKDILSYVVEAFNQWEGYWRVMATNVMPAPDNKNTYYYNVTTLRPFSTYLLRMRAENELGASAPSLPSDSFTTSPIKPDRYPEQVGGGGGKVGELTITWQPLDPWEYNAEGIGYEVRWRDQGDYDEDWDGIEVIYGGTTARYVVLVGQDNYYKDYEVAVKAVNEVGEGPLSPVVSIKSAMGLPTAIAQDVRSQPYNATACLVHWIPVDDDKTFLKGKLGGYRISYWKECCETEEMAPRVTINGQAEEGMVIGLYPDTPYFFDVMVFNEAGNGPKSQYFIQRTLRNAPIEPPVEVQVERRASDAIYLKWRGVSTTNVEEPLEGYKVRMWRSGTDIKNATDYDAAKETDLYIDGLRSDVTYRLRVFGYSRAGDGTMSSPTVRFMLGGASMATISWLAVFSMCLLHLLQNILWAS